MLDEPESEWSPPLPRDETWAREALLKIVQEHLEEWRRARRWRFAFKALSMGFFALIFGMSLFAGWRSYRSAHTPHAAVVRIEGEIAANGQANADRIIQGLRNAFSAEKSKAVVIEINSPGGSPVQAGMIHDEIKRLRDAHPEKKVVSIIDDIGASGGYYIAVAADRIYANRASIVGSIGVRLDSFGFTGAMKKLGIERRLYTAGKYKGTLDMFTEPESEALKHIEHMLEKVHQQFIHAVKTGREGLLKNDPLLFSGLFWSGEESLSLGLIDGFGDRRRIIEEQLKLESTLDYTPSEDFMKRLGKIQASMSALLAGLSPVFALAM